MDTYPIAGTVIESRLFFGLSAKDVGQVLLVPLLVLGIAQSIGITGTLFRWLGGGGLAVGIIVLLVTPSAQSPLGYARATIQYYLGTTTYRNRRSEHDRPRGHVQDVVETRDAGVTVADMPAATEDD